MSNGTMSVAVGSRSLAAESVRRAARPGTARWLEIGAAGVLAIFCVLTRIVNLEQYTGSYPEGIRAAQLMLMAAGFRPFRDIFSDQGPWLLQTLYPGYLLFDASLVGVRFGVVVASLLGLAGCYWVVRQTAGPIGGLLAALLLGLSPIYLQFSRLAVAEVLALAPAVVALGCAIRRMNAVGDRWLYLAGACLAVSMLIKPITLGVALPVGLAAWLSGGRRWRNLAVVGGTTAGVVLGGVLLVGLPEIVEQIVQFRLASRGAEGWSLTTNLTRFRVELAPEGLALPLLAAVGSVCAGRERRAWPLLAWLLAGVGTVLAHSPLHSKHFAIVVMPLAALAAFGVARLLHFAVRGERARRLALLGGLIGAAGWLALLPPVLARDVRLLTSDNLFDGDPAQIWYVDAVESLLSAVRPGEYVVTDHAYLAWAAGRLIPPGLVEASATRVRAGSLTDAMAIDETGRYDARAILLWADKLEGLPGYHAWLTEHYAPVKTWAADGETSPRLWVRADARLDALRDRLSGELRPPDAPADFDEWRLARYRLALEPRIQEARDGTRVVCTAGFVTVTLEFESIAEQAQDARVVLQLRDGDGQRVVDDETEPLLGRPVPASWLHWTARLRVPRTTSARAAEADDYAVSAQLVDRRERPLGAAVELGRIPRGTCT